MHEPKYSLKTYNGMSSLCNLRWEGLEEELLPLSVRRTQKPQQREEQRASFYEFQVDFWDGGSLDDIFSIFHQVTYTTPGTALTGTISYAVIRVLNFINIFILWLTFSWALTS